MQVMVKKSEELEERARAAILGGVNSPLRTFQGVGIPQLILSKGFGSKIWDVDGNEYTDYCMSWGALLLGHAPLSVTKAVCERVMKGSSFGVTTEEEILLAEKIREHYPAVERLRCVSSGTEATMTAVRIARGYTGKEYIVKFDGNYHGHADPFLVKAGSGATSLSGDSFSKGIPKGSLEKTISIPYNDIAAIKRVFETYSGKIAAAIVEPIAGNMGLVPGDKEFLKALQEACKSEGAVFIFDEVISGFRVGFGGASEYYGITPDLVTLGKVIGGGYPAAAVGGKKEILEVLAPIGSVYQAGTLSGNPVAMAAGLETIRTVERESAYELLERLGQRLEKGLSAVLRTGVLSRIGSMFTLFWGEKAPERQADLARLDSDRFIAFFKHMYERGIYVPQAQSECCFLSLSHTEEDIDAFISAVEEFER